MNASKCWSCYQWCNQEKERLLFCDVCKENLSIDAFNNSDTKIYVELRNMFRYSFLRCRNCATCKTCGIAKLSKAFKENDAHCRNCAKLHCGVCDKDLPRHAFSSSQIRNMTLGQNAFLRCSGCHTCTRCSRENISVCFMDMSGIAVRVQNKR